MITILSVGWDYVSELLRPTGVFFIPQVIQDRGELVERPTGETPNSSTRSLWPSYQQNNLAAKEENLVKEMMNLAVEVSLFILRSVFTYH
jgi:hypothetical protein